MRNPGSRPARPAGTATPDLKKNPFVITVAILLGIVLLVALASEVVTRYMWFDQIGFQNILTTRWLVQAALFVATLAVTMLPLFFSLRYAYRRRPLYPPVTRDDEMLEQFRSSIDPLRRILTIALPAVIGLFAGLAAAQNWQTFVMVFNQTPFGTADPVFGHDYAFYVFTVPVLEAVLSLLEFVMLATLIGSVIVHYFYGGVTLNAGDKVRLSITPAARRHLGLLGAGYVLLLGANQWLSRYDLLTASNERFMGAGYTDVHAALPAKTIIAIVAIIVAGSLVFWALRGNGKIAAAGAGLLLLTMITIGWAYPALIQNFRVDPNAQTLEEPYIARNIDATRDAFGLSDIEVVPYSANTTAEAGALREDADTTAQIRLLDPTIVSPSFAQLEQNRQYYGFAQILAVDRYRFDDAIHDTVIGVRELNQSALSESQSGWVNEHTVYTHGYGVVAAYGSHAADDGAPDFFQRGIPSTGQLGEYEERIYFGRNSPEYSIVGAPEDAAPQELDYPTGGEEGSGQVNTTYEGDGGPSIGPWWSRLLHAVNFRDVNLLISDYVNEQSQILYNRDPQQRVRDVAPFLTLDSSVYPAVVDGRVVWIVDAYTTSNEVPYAQQIGLDSATADSQQEADAAAAIRGTTVNYMRNSVKATVDAYNGSVTLYAWDTEDPVLQTWQNTFPGSFQPMSEISSELMGHLRYPEDLFKAQRSLLTRYHITDAAEFFSAQDLWQIPNDPTTQTETNETAPTEVTGPGTIDTTLVGSNLQPPFYLTMQMPGQEEPAFSLSTSFIPGGGDNRNILTGFLAVNSETGTAEGQVDEDFGRLTLLELPVDEAIAGPGQVQNTFNANPAVSTELNLLRTGNSRVIMGNLLTVPVGGGLLYVQPVYVQSSGETSYPLLQRVLVSFGETVGFAPTLDQALDEVFQGDSGAEAGDADVDAPGNAGSAAADETPPNGGEPADPPAEQPTEQPTEAPPNGGEPAEQPTEAPADQPATDPQARLDQAISDMEAALVDAETAQQSGDWAAYGEAQARLEDALQRAGQANAELQGG